jgi:hypothetical protein
MQQQQTSSFTDALDRLRQPSAVDYLGKSSSTAKDRLQQGQEKMQPWLATGSERLRNLGGSLGSQTLQLMGNTPSHVRSLGEHTRQLMTGTFSSSTSSSSNNNKNNGLQSLNERMREEAERRNIRLASEEACLNAMRDHLIDFLKAKPSGTYEQWIEDLHPENAHDPMLLTGMDKEIDLRFYVKESDHLQLWNSFIRDPIRQIQPRNRMWKDSQKSILQTTTEPVDLLGGNDDSITKINDIAISITGTMTSQEDDLIQF